jgi:hypothetical protein
VKSATQVRFGASATKSWSRRSGTPFGGRVGDGGDDLPAAHGSGDAELAHEAFDGAAGHGVALPVQLPSDLPSPVDPVVGVEDLLDQVLEFRVPQLAGGGIFLALRVGGIGGEDDAAVVLGERRCGRSRSAAKKPAAALRISFARFSSAFSCFNALPCEDSSVVVPGRVPQSI